MRLKFILFFFFKSNGNTTIVARTNALNDVTLQLPSYKKIALDLMVVVTTSDDLRAPHRSPPSLER